MRVAAVVMLSAVAIRSCNAFIGRATGAAVDAMGSVHVPRRCLRNKSRHKPWPATSSSGSGMRWRLGSGSIEVMEIPSDEELAAECASRTGTVYVRNTQRSYKIDTQQLEQHIRAARDLLGYSNWDVSLWLTTDKTVRKLNSQYRGKDKSTDILSFSYNEVETPGKLAKVRHPEEMDLGEMMVSLAYVDRVIQQDKAEQEGQGQEEEEEHDRGVSGAMSRVFTVQERLPLLCIHGLLHLVGYDHETDEDYEVMVAREEELLRALKLEPSPTS
eukprot:TRINITY_DN7992_c0_g1_i1.p1 TRINITY_DN7992_c0_g1~~TRINITY_DN7992_c0_g1_i1.p1  ORF type:complete len:272 (-),score=59.52 TRINITY_DN7992_c0_g1_i1:489-1304(-)